MKKFLIGLAVLLQFSVAFCAHVCPSVALKVDSTNICPPTLYYDAELGKCCMIVEDVPGSKGRYCNIAAKIGNIYKCPITHPYDEDSKMCCGPSPITGRIVETSNLTVLFRSRDRRSEKSNF